MISRRSVFLQPIELDQLSRTDRQSRRAAQYRRLEDDQRAIRASRAACCHSDSAHLTAEFRLWDVATGQQVAGQQYSTDASNSRRVAHLIADAVFTRITGETGFFDSHVVFVDETGPAQKRRKRLAIMDMDGGNVKYLTRGDDLVVTPRFSPSAQQIAYMSFGASRSEGFAAQHRDRASTRRSAIFPA